MNEKKLLLAYKDAYEKGYRRFGLLCMQASNIFNYKYYQSLLIYLTEIFKKIQKIIHAPIEYLDLGGGFGISINGTHDLDLNELNKILNIFLQKNPDCKIFLEQIGRAHV